MRIPTKKEKLEHYERLENPTAFIQLDIFNVTGDSFLIEDANGLSATISSEYELMSGVYNVRILIRPDTTKDIVLKALKKAANLIEDEDILASQNAQIKNNEQHHHEQIKTERQRQRTTELCELLFKKGFSLAEVKKSLGDYVDDCIPF
ncbi:MAG: hypothetical protein HZB37_02440 [Planctomycetes bacterium]|nr:hypothetical protein [Planctomycetota bacterium]